MATHMHMHSPHPLHLIMLISKLILLLFQPYYVSSITIADNNIKHKNPNKVINLPSMLQSCVTPQDIVNTCSKITTQNDSRGNISSTALVRLSKMCMLMKTDNNREHEIITNDDEKINTKIITSLCEVLAHAMFHQKVDSVDAVIEGLK